MTQAIRELPPDHKTCNGCGELKPLDAFGIRRVGRSRDGHNARCRVCVGARKRQWAEANPEARKRKGRRWARKNPPIPEVKRSRRAVLRAVAAGDLVRPAVCGQCGVGCKPDGHHEDYSKPLEVVWLCRSCHSALHRETKA